MQPKGTDRFSKSIIRVVNGVVQVESEKKDPNEIEILREKLLIKNKKIKELKAEIKKLTKRIIKKPNSKPNNSYLNGIDFYDSKQWLKLRYKALNFYGRQCMSCKTKEGEMHVDHIKPRSKYPHLELDFSNLQILCKKCNLGKSNLDSTDFRSNNNVIILKKNNSI